MRDLNDVAVFASVAKELSFTRAARALGIPKSSVSERVARLEARLGVRLLERTTRSLRLTPSGEAYFARVVRVVQELDDADADVVAAHCVPSGVLRVGSPLLFAQIFLDDVVHEYLSRFPDVRVDLLVEDRPFSVFEEGLDAAVHAVGRLDTQLVARKLGTVERWCVAAPAYVEKHGAPTEPMGLSAHACLSGGLLRESRWTFHRGDATVAVDVTPRYLVSSLELAHRAALRGAGIAVSPAALAADDIAGGRLIRLLPEWMPAERTISIVYPSQRHLPARVRAFIDLVVERFNAVKDMKHPRASRLRELFR